MWTVFVASVLLGGVISCTRDSRSANGLGADEIGVELNIITRSMNSDSETYETGTTWENLIDIEGGDYRIYFFTNDKNDATATTASEMNTLIAELVPANLDVVAVSGSSYTKYTIIGRVDEEIAAYSELKIVAVANWGTYPVVEVGETTIDDLVEDLDAQFSIEDYLPTSTGFTNERLMPFYGVNEYSGLVWKEGWRTILDGDLTLLRALAKVEVIFEPEDDDDSTFDAVRIVRYNSEGYCAPSKVYLKEDYDHNGVWAEDYTSDVHLVGDGNDTEVKTWDFWQTDENTWLIYLPEYDNMGDDYCRIEVETDGVVYPIYFANYYDGFTTAYSEDETADMPDRYDVYRNCYYRFITNLGADVWEFDMYVKQYAAVSAWGEFGFTYDGFYYEQDDENMSIEFNVLDVTSTFVMIPTLLYNGEKITDIAEWTCECTSAPETSVIVTKSPTVSEGPVEIHVTALTATPGYVHKFLLTAGWYGNDGKERSITYTITVDVEDGMPDSYDDYDGYIQPSDPNPNSVGTNISAPAKTAITLLFKG